MGCLTDREDGGNKNEFISRFQLKKIDLKFKKKPYGKRKKEKWRISLL